jgi:hypothetical protein
MDGLKIRHAKTPQISLRRGNCAVAQDALKEIEIPPGPQVIDRKSVPQGVETAPYPSDS